MEKITAGEIVDNMASSYEIPSETEFILVDDLLKWCVECESMEDVRELKRSL